MRSLPATLVALVAVLVLAGTGFAGGRATTKAVYRPFTAAGTLKPSIRVDQTLSGSCFAGSLATPRRDAWRCTVANDLYDPCFSDRSGTAGFVVCPEFGSQPRRVARIDLTKALPRSGNTGRPGARTGQPWAVLARPYAGYCSRATGTASSYKGRRISYECGLGGSLVGRLRRSSRPWTAKLLTEGDNPILYTVRIPIAWY